MKDNLLLLSEKDVQSLLTPRDVIETVEEVYRLCARNDAIYGPIGKMFVDGDKMQNMCMTFPSGLRSLNTVGMKWFCGYNKPAPGYPFSHGNMLLLCNLQTGSPFALTGAGTITTMRTAGGHCVVGARHLANPDPETLAVVGSGAQAMAGIRGFLEEFPSLKKVQVWSRSARGEERIRQRFCENTPVEFCFCDSPENTVQGANIVLVATTSPDILVKAEWIRPSMTVIPVSAFVDLDPAIAEKADKWVLGSYKEDLHNIIDTPALCHGYTLPRDKVWADMPEIVEKKKPAREREDEIILCSHMGMGFFDIACGKKVYERALEQNRGQQFVLDEYPVG